VLKTPVKTNSILEGVRYEIRGELAARAFELERQGYEIISLNIGNPSSPSLLRLLA
jgi:alanine-synthesizing transaminase